MAITKANVVETICVTNGFSKNKIYEKELLKLQHELVKLQGWVQCLIWKANSELTKLK